MSRGADARIFIGQDRGADAAAEIAMRDPLTGGDAWPGNDVWGSPSPVDKSCARNQSPRSPLFARSMSSSFKPNPPWSVAMPTRAGKRFAHGGLISASDRLRDYSSNSCLVWVAAFGFELGRCAGRGLAGSTPHWSKDSMLNRTLGEDIVS